MTAQPESIADRVAKLERQQRKWKVLATGVCLAAVAWLLVMRGERIAPRIAAEEFRLVDRKGVSRAVLGIMAQGPVLAFRDEAGLPRAVIGIGSVDGPGVVLADPAGKPRAELVIRNGIPTLALADAAGTVRAELLVQPEGTALRLSAGSIQIVDRDGKLVVKIPHE